MKNTKKQYAFNFIGGGWNSVWAFNKPEAKQIIIAKYGTFRISSADAPRTINPPNLDTIRILKPEEEKELLAAFW
jgi:hypothetical protein